MITFATLFAGGGLADIGLQAAGLTPLWAVEHDYAIGSVYLRNHGDHLIIQDVRQVDYAHLARPDLLWMSPPCPSFSVAKTGRGETANDLSIAAACAAAIKTLRPAAVILENVRGYADSESFRIIRAALDRLDYWSHAQVVNAADCGTPQTRERLILRAIPGGWMQAHRPWPAPVRWRGWYEAIADLVPTLPDSAFAPWQLARLPAELRESVLVNEDSKMGMLAADEPAMTMVSSRRIGNTRAFILDDQESGTKRGARAWLVEGTGQGQDRAPVRSGDDPCFTVKGGWTTANRALILPGRVVAMTPRALARFQSVPDTYWLPDKKSLACRVIGNGVAVDVARVAAETLRGAL